VPKARKGEEDERTRAERLRESDPDSPHLDLPPLESPLDDYASMLFDVGPVASSGFGAIGISWTEISAWVELTGAVLAPWEARLLRRLSIQYAGWTREMSERDVPAPYSSLPDLPDYAVADRLDSVATALGGIFSQMKKVG